MAPPADNQIPMALLDRPEVERARARYLAGLVATALGVLVGAIALGRFVANAPASAVWALAVALTAFAAALALFGSASIYVLPDGHARLSDMKALNETLDGIRLRTKAGARVGLAAVAAVLLAAALSGFHQSGSVQILVDVTDLDIGELKECNPANPIEGTAARGELLGDSTLVRVTLTDSTCNSLAGNQVFVERSRVSIPKPGG